MFHTKIPPRPSKGLMNCYPNGKLVKPDYLFVFEGNDPYKSIGKRSMVLTPIGAPTFKTIRGKTGIELNGTSQYLIGQTTPVFTSGEAVGIVIYCEFQHYDTTSRESTLVSQMTTANGNKGFRCFLTQSHSTNTKVGLGSTSTTLYQTSGLTVPAASRWANVFQCGRVAAGSSYGIRGGSLNGEGGSSNDSTVIGYSYYTPADSGVKFLIGATDGTSINALMHGVIRTVAIWICPKGIPSPEMLKSVSRFGLDRVYYRARKNGLSVPLVEEVHYVSSKEPKVYGYPLWLSGKDYSQGEVVVAVNSTYGNIFLSCVKGGRSGITTPTVPNTRPALINDGTVFWRCVSGKRQYPHNSIKLPLSYREWYPLIRVEAPSSNPLRIATSEVWYTKSGTVKNDADWRVHANPIRIVGGLDEPDYFYVTGASISANYIVSMKWGSFYCYGMVALGNGEVRGQLGLYFEECQVVLDSCELKKVAITGLKAHLILRDTALDQLSQPDTSSSSSNVEPKEYNYSGPYPVYLVFGKFEMSGGELKSHAVGFGGGGLCKIELDGVSIAAQNALTQLNVYSAATVVVRGGVRSGRLASPVKNIVYTYYSLDLMGIQDSLKMAELNFNGTNVFKMGIYREGTTAVLNRIGYSLGCAVSNEDSRYCPDNGFRIRRMLTREGDLTLRVYGVSATTSLAKTSCLLKVEYVTRDGKMKVARSIQINSLVDQSSILVDVDSTSVWVGALYSNFVKMEVQLVNAVKGEVVIYVNGLSNFDPMIEEV